MSRRRRTASALFRPTSAHQSARQPFRSSNRIAIGACMLSMPRPTKSPSTPCTSTRLPGRMRSPDRSTIFGRSAGGRICALLRRTTGSEPPPCPPRDVCVGCQSWLNDRGCAGATQRASGRSHRQMIQRPALMGRARWQRLQGVNGRRRRHRFSAHACRSSSSTHRRAPTAPAQCECRHPLQQNAWQNCAAGCAGWRA